MQSMRFFFFFSLCFLSIFSFEKNYSKNFLTDQEKEELFLNILFVWYERISGILTYTEISKSFFEKIDQTDIEMINRFRNPSHKKVNGITLSQSLFFEFDECVFKLDRIFDEYVLLVDLGKKYLTEEQKIVLNKIKIESLGFILKKLLTLKNLFTFCENFYEAITEKNYSASRELVFYIDNIEHEFVKKRDFNFNLFENMNYYKNIYVSTDRLIIKIFESFLEAKITMRNLLNQFWYVVSFSLLDVIKYEYNKRSISYNDEYGDTLRLNLIAEEIFDMKKLPKEIL
jgi:hypothetical protein